MESTPSTTVGAKKGAANAAGGGAAANGVSNTRTGGSYNIFNGGKIRIDLTNTKYKLIRECALE